jgi:tRNA dimethylallyltransferase
LNHPLVVIVGETGSGKSSLAMDIARRFNGEIVGADSWTVYRDFNIGTAKPTTADMAEIPHHMFNVVTAPDGFNAALYKSMALTAIAGIVQRGKLPILVGGTGLYIDSIIFDYNFLPPGEPMERERLNSLSLDELLAEASQKRISLEAIDHRNKRRVIRAIETNGQVPSSRALRENTLVIGISPEREHLRERITKRVDTMMQAGLEYEVQELSATYGWGVEPMKGIGYYEWRDYFLGTQSLAQTRDRIISSTMNLAKRQRTWFKRNSSIHWLSNRDKYVDILTTYLNKNT